MRRLSWIVSGVALFGCKPAGGSGVPGGKTDVTVMRAAYADDSDAPAEVKRKCKFDEKVAEAVVDAAPGASLSSGSSSKVLSMDVVAVRGVDPTWQGDRSVIVRGRLEDGGVELGTFRIKRSAPGGVFSGMTGVCRGLDEIADIIGEDVAEWLADPQPRTDLGE